MHLHFKYSVSDVSLEKRTQVLKMTKARVRVLCITCILLLYYKKGG